MLTVTVVKRKETRGSEHWSCAIVGEGEVSTSKFGVPLTTVNPHDVAEMREALDRGR